MVSQKTGSFHFHRIQGKSIWAPIERTSIRVTAAKKVIEIAEEENNQVLEEHRDLFNRKAITTRSQRHIDMKDVIGNKFRVTVRSLMNNDGLLIPGH